MLFILCFVRRTEKIVSSMYFKILNLIFTESCSCKGLHYTDINLRLLQLHIFLTSVLRVFCLKCSIEHLALRCPCCPSSWRGVPHFSLMFCRRCLLCDMIIYALMFLVWWEVDFSGLWLLYFCINAVLKTYLLDLYSYRKHFILISLKEKNKSLCFMYCLNLVCQIWFVTAEGKVYFLFFSFFFFVCVLHVS